MPSMKFYRKKPNGLVEVVSVRFSDSRRTVRNETAKQALMAAVNAGKNRVLPTRHEAIKVMQQAGWSREKLWTEAPDAQSRPA